MIPDHKTHLGRTVLYRTLSRELLPGSEKTPIYSVRGSLPQEGKIVNWARTETGDHMKVLTGTQATWYRADTIDILHTISESDLS